jgi:hypothetical protein
VTVAEGYEPIVITETITNQQTKRDFDANIEILTEESVATNQIISE